MVEQPKIVLVLLFLKRDLVYEGHYKISLSALHSEEKQLHKKQNKVIFIGGCFFFPNTVCRHTAKVFEARRQNASTSTRIHKPATLKNKTRAEITLIATRDIGKLSVIRQLNNFSASVSL